LIYWLKTKLTLNFYELVKVNRLVILKTVLIKKVYSYLCAALLFIAGSSDLFAQDRPVVHVNLTNTSGLNIRTADFGNDYVITGNVTINNNTNPAHNNTTNPLSIGIIRVQPGYQGTITLRNLNITVGASNVNSPIRIIGQNNRSNLNPISNVNIVLEGTNNLRYTGNQGAAAFQVDQGTQINIRAIDPSNNASGVLNAIVTTDGGGAGIGSLNRGRNDNVNTNETTATAPIITA